MDLFGFKESLEKLERSKTEIPDKLSVKILEAFEKNFDSESFFGGQKWKPRKYDYKTKKYGPILGGRSGRLASGLTIKSATFDDITIAVEGEAEDWAYVHNEGTDIMPQRQFVGDNEELEKMIKEEIEKMLGEIWD